MERLKRWLQGSKHSSSPLRRAVARVLYGCIGFARTVWGILTTPETRSLWYMKLFRGNSVHQTSSTTCLNRYPQIFSACRDYFAGREDITVLSFGCSTGEEVVTLRKYFPKARIIGAEINEHSLSVCRGLGLDSGVSFIRSQQELLESHGPYDLIFCMAVFQRTPAAVAEKNITDISKLYPFAKFEKQTALLDSCLRPGGLMVVHWSQYDFSDTAAAAGYTPYTDLNQDGYGPYVFGPDGKQKPDPTGRPSIYRKDP